MRKILRFVELHVLQKNFWTHLLIHVFLHVKTKKVNINKIFLQKCEPSLYNNIDNIKGNSCVTSFSKVDKNYADEKRICTNECPNN